MLRVIGLLGYELKVSPIQANVEVPVAFSASILRAEYLPKVAQVVHLLMLVLRLRLANK